MGAHKIQVNRHSMPGICSALKAEIWDGVRPATDEKKKKKRFQVSSRLLSKKLHLEAIEQSYLKQSPLCSFAVFYHSLLSSVYSSGFNEKQVLLHLSGLLYTSKLL